MIRSEVLAAFRVEAPEITDRVVTDAQAYVWLEQGNLEFCTETRCIVDQDGTTISTTEDDIYYDLTTEITSFMDIDDYPGSGILYNDKKLEKTTMAKLDSEDPTWRDGASGTPTKWYRRGKYLYLDRKIDSNEYDLKVYSVLLPTAWTSDVAPYNALSYLEPYHYAMVLYLIKRAKAKVGKPEDVLKAQAEYTAFIKWAKSQLGGNKLAEIMFKKPSSLTPTRYK